MKVRAFQYLDIRILWVEDENKTNNKATAYYRMSNRLSLLFLLYFDILKDFLRSAKTLFNVFWGYLIQEICKDLVNLNKDVATEFCVSAVDNGSVVRWITNIFNALYILCKVD